MKRSGQRWSIDGGQAVLGFRALAQSERFDGAWQLFSADYRREISVSENVVPMNALRVSSLCEWHPIESIGSADEIVAGFWGN